MPDNNQKSNFFALLGRMRLISRWSLMRGTDTENISEHSLQTAMIAHALAVIHNRRLCDHPADQIDPQKTALTAMFHDAGEILTGDLPTPVKYYDPHIREAYRRIESNANDHLLSMLPDDLQEEYRAIFYDDDSRRLKLVRAADKLSALTKCVEEQKAGNREFDSACTTLKKTLDELCCPEAEIFIDLFLDGFSLTLDEQQK